MSVFYMLVAWIVFHFFFTSALTLPVTRGIRVFLMGERDGGTPFFGDLAVRACYGLQQAGLVPSTVGGWRIFGSCCGRKCVER